jgi:prophage antirepressor-like protein
LSNLIPFQFDGRAVRVIDIGSEPWFVAKDVAEAIGYSNPTDAISNHCKGVAKRYPLQTSGGTQDVRIISEPDVLRLIVKSGLPAAEKFERLVFEEILPSIRRTGTYTIGKPKTTATETLEAVKLFRPFFQIARMIGCDKSSAAVSANQAVQAVAGPNVLALMGQTHMVAENQDALFFTPTELGERIGLSGRKLNLLLAEAGFQMKRGEVWEATETGKDFARIYDTGKRHGSGVPIQQIKWAATVLPLLKQGEEA